MGRRAWTVLLSNSEGRLLVEFGLEGRDMRLGCFSAAPRNENRTWRVDVIEMM